MCSSILFVTVLSASRPPAVNTFMPLYIAGLWLAVTAMPYGISCVLTTNIISGVGDERFIIYTLKPQPTSTSAAQCADSFDRKRLS